MNYNIIYGDITKQKSDVIVNAANASLRRGGGVCGAIFAAAGAKALIKECRKIGKCKEGEAVITSGFALSKYIIHTVGVKYRGGGSVHEKAEIMANCYKNSLKLAEEYSCKTIVFPFIGAGVFGWSADDAFQIADTAIRAYEYNTNIAVSLILFDK